MQESKLIHMIFFLPEKTLALHHVIILIKSVSNKNQNQYYYNIDLKKCSYQLSRNSDDKFLYKL